MKTSWNFRLISLVVLLSLAVTLFLSFWLGHFSKTTIQIQAEMNATDWISGFERTVPQLDDILAGEPVTASQRQFIEGTMLGSAVFQVQIFDRNGVKLFDSSIPGAGVPPETEHYITAEDVALTGKTDLAVETGDSALGEPATYVEAYMPFYGDQAEPIGVVELYVDVSGAAVALNQKFGWVSAIASIATLLVLVVPGIALVKQYEALKERDEKLKNLARTDSLTGLLNRRGSAQSLAAATRRMSPSDKAWVQQIDLDKFKPINDVFGHQVGDQLLKEIAARLRTTLGSLAIIARTGGDEFFVFQISTLSEDEYLQQVDQLRESLSKPVRIDGRNCHIGASIGVSAWTTTCHKSIEDTVQQADMALHVAKDSGRNTVVLFEAAMHDKVLREAQIAEDVAAGLAEGHFTAHFQPIFDMTSMRIVGYEALARWVHPDHGTLLPGTFLAASEKAGLMAAIDRSVFAEAVKLAKQLKQIGRSDLPISINVSSVQLKQRDIVEQYLWVIDANDLSQSQFRIEVLESTLLEERSAHVIDNLVRFHELGFKIDLDDFGTGHTAIASLHQLPVDRIKIDRSLVTGLAQDRNLAILTGVIASLGAQLDLEVVAEGVENEADLKAVRGLGIATVQGYLFAKPMPATDCLTSLNSQQALGAAL